MTTPAPPDACPACGAAASFAALHSNIEALGERYDVHVCTACGLGVTVPFPSDEVCARIYATGVYRDPDRRFMEPVESLVRYAQGARLREIEAELPARSADPDARPRRMLDVGCGRGLTLKLAREAGWDAVGIEYNDDTAQGARAHGLDIRTGPLAAQRFDAESFDVVKLWHSLEHIPDAADTLTEAARILRPGGLLTVTVPNFDSWQARFAGRHWFHLDVPFHLYHFPLPALKRMFSERGVEPSAVSQFSLEQNPYGWLQSMLNRAGLPHNALYGALRTASGGIKGGFFAILLSVLLSVPGVPLALALSAGEALAGRGGTVTLFGIKKSGITKETSR